MSIKSYDHKRLQKSLKFIGQKHLQTFWDSPFDTFDRSHTINVY